MSINLGTYALVSALAVGGAVAQHQYSQPAGPQDNSATTESGLQGNGSDATSTMTGPLDCSGLMSRHQQMIQQLSAFDEQANMQLTQMKEATSDRAKLDATMGLVETLVTQRKQMRDQMMAMEHDTLQFVLANTGTDLTTSCPQMTQWLEHGATLDNAVNTDPNATELGGPDDMELGQQAEPQQPPSQQPQLPGHQER